MGFWNKIFRRLHLTQRAPGEPPANSASPANPNPSPVATAVSTTPDNALAQAFYDGYVAGSRLRDTPAATSLHMVPRNGTPEANSDWKTVSLHLKITNGSVQNSEEGSSDNNSSPAPRPRQTRLLPPPPPDTDRMTPEVLRDVLCLLDKHLGHLRWVLSGRASLAVWGFPDRLPKYLSIQIPDGDQALWKAWIKTVGWYTYSDEPDVYGVPTSDRRVCKIRIRPISPPVDFEPLFERSVRAKDIPPARYDDGSGELVTARLFHCKARILSLASLLDQFTYTWVYNHARVVHPSLVTEGDTRDYELETSNVAERILWILNHIAAGFGPRLTPFSVPGILAEDFWLDFMLDHPEFLDLMEACGLYDLPSTPTSPRVPYRDRLPQEPLTTNGPAPLASHPARYKPGAAPAQQTSSGSTSPAAPYSSSSRNVSSGDDETDDDDDENSGKSTPNHSRNRLFPRPLLADRVQPIVPEPLFAGNSLRSPISDPLATDRDKPLPPPPLPAHEPKRPLLAKPPSPLEHRHILRHKPSPPSSSENIRTLYTQQEEKQQQASSRRLSGPSVSKQASFTSSVVRKVAEPQVEESGWYPNQHPCYHQYFWPEKSWV
ncbi:hypothetical protein B0H63DRAFT_530986 [Podospora didyma]|uniref:Uncharacterized protein n=1 Tax=Podospora didyma TaxID=330526 RepID=A0AAE0P4U6_9PEZI|nr:hypothetical protein B0H63DRAFT_530986 [Podospora didyma]